MRGAGPKSTLVVPPIKVLEEDLLCSFHLSRPPCGIGIIGLKEGGNGISRAQKIRDRRDVLRNVLDVGLDLAGATYGHGVLAQIDLALDRAVDDQVLLTG